ncbi:Kiwa anti-phage protein KwaB-like domain-containing protein, partial [Salmonella sp. SAL04269]
INLLERAYGLEQVINNLAANATPHIIALNILDVSNHPNPADIFNDMHRNRNFMRRLATTANSPLLQNGTINIANIQTLIQNFPILGRNI